MARRRFQRGSVFLRGKRDPVWVGRWREDVIALDGLHKRLERKEILGSKKDFPTKKLALRELESRLAPINCVSYRAMRTASFAEFCKIWQDNALSQHKQSTQATINSLISCHLLPFFGGFALRDIHGQNVQMFINGCKCAPKTVRNLILAMKMIWKSAKAWGYINHNPYVNPNPFEGLTIPRRPKRQAFFFTISEVVQIIAEAEEPYKTYYWLAAETGMRAGELCGLRADDVYVENCIIGVRQSAWRSTLQTPKTDNAVRWFPISPKLATHLKTFLETWRPNEKRLLFITSFGSPWAPCNFIRSNLKPLLGRLKIEHPKRCGIHAFRHTSGSMLDRINAPLKVRQERLGHALGSSVTVDLYTHTVPEDHRRVATELGELLRPNAPTFSDEPKQGMVIQ